MLITVEDLSNFWKVSPKGVIHVGAHNAEERESYVRAGWGPPFIWIEAQATKFEHLRANLPNSDLVIQGAAWSEGNQEISLHVTNNSQSSSVLELHEHRDLYPEIQVVERELVQTVRIDEVIPNELELNFLAIDIQGAELEALKGSVKLLPKINWIYVEVNKRPIYSGCSLVEEIDVFLEVFGFRRVQTYWVHGSGWGDAIYCRLDVIPSFFESKPLLRLIRRASYVSRFARRPHLMLSTQSRKRFKRCLRRILKKK